MNKMWYNHRTLQENSDDFKKMGAFVSGLNSKGIYDWSVGRLFAWYYGRWSEKSQNADCFSKQAELFFNYFGELCGLVITEGFGDNYYLLSNGNDFVTQAMLDFLLKGGNFCTPLFINVSKNDERQIAVLKRNGLDYAWDADATYTYTANSVKLPEIKLPDGYVLTSQAEFKDSHSLELLRFTTFNPDEVFDNTQDIGFKFCSLNPLLDPHLAIVLLSDKNEPVSSCVGYLDRENQMMEIEVVVTKQGYENKGFAKVVISECIKRGVLMGVKTFAISAWEDKTKKLYSSFGSCTETVKAFYKLAE